MLVEWRPRPTRYFRVELYDLGGCCWVESLSAGEFLASLRARRPIKWQVCRDVSLAAAYGLYRRFVEAFDSRYDGVRLVEVTEKGVEELMRYIR